MNPKFLKRLKNAYAALINKPYPMVEPTVHIVRKEMRSEIVQAAVYMDRYGKLVNVDDMYDHVRRELRNRIAWAIDEMGAMKIQSTYDPATGGMEYRARVEVLMPENGGFDDESYCD